MRIMSAKNKRIVSYLQSNPDAKPSYIAKKFKTSVVTVYALKSKMKSAVTNVKRKKPFKLREKIGTYTQKPSTLVPNAVMSMAVYADDMVNHPPHYKTGGIETIDFIEAKNLGYNLGNVVKYISRADYKGDRLENLKKAQWYMNREVALASKK